MPTSPSAQNIKKKWVPPAIGELPHPSDLKAYGKLLALYYAYSMRPSQDQPMLVTEESILTAGRGELWVARQPGHVPAAWEEELAVRQRAELEETLVANALGLPQKKRSAASIAGADKQAVQPPAAGRPAQLNLTATVARQFRNAFLEADTILFKQAVILVEAVNRHFSGRPEAMEDTSTMVKGSTPKQIKGDIPGTTQNASQELTLFFNAFARDVLGDGSHQRSSMPRKFLGGLSALDLELLKLCSTAVGKNGERAGQTIVNRFRVNMLNQFLVTRGLARIIQGITRDFITLQADADHEVLDILCRHFIKHFNKAIAPLVKSLMQHTDKHHRSLVVSVQTPEEHKHDRISSLLGRELSRDEGDQVVRSRSLQLAARSEQRRFNHAIGDFHVWMGFDELAQPLQVLITKAVKQYRHEMVMPVLQSACHTAALVYQHRFGSELSQHEKKALSRLIDLLHGPAFTPRAHESESDQSEKLENSERTEQSLEGSAQLERSSEQSEQSSS
ncbi:MAG: hypothetical protein ACRYGK_15300 [Janthinobacterium lividum]